MKTFEEIQEIIHKENYNWLNFGDEGFFHWKNYGIFVPECAKDKIPYFYLMVYSTGEKFKIKTNKQFPTNLRGNLLEQIKVWIQSNRDKVIGFYRSGQRI